MVSSGFLRLNNLPGQKPSQASGARPQQTTDRVRQFQNQQIPGLSTGTGSRVGQQMRPQSHLAAGMQRPGQSQVALSAKRRVSAVSDSNKRLLGYAQQAGEARRRRMSMQGQYRGSGSGGVNPYGGGTPRYQPQASGGHTLGRIQQMLRRYPGLRITDTVSNPARDRHYGLARSPNSYHYDQRNPAVDIAGSPAQLHRLYRELVAVGGWRQILWQVPGHYDHIHVA